MGLFINEKSIFNIKVNYVYSKDGELHVLSDEDVKKIKDKSYKNDEESFELMFNKSVFLKDYTEEDIKEANMVFRTPGFKDATFILKSLEGAQGIDEDMVPSKMLEFSHMRLNRLFVSGTAQDESGGIQKITKDNIENISLNLCMQASLEISSHINM